MRPWLLLLCLTACDDHLFLPEGGALTPDWCGSEPILQTSCAIGGCHDAATATSGLDLETDALAALVDVASPNYADTVYVVPGDADSSLLYRKIAGTQSDDEGPRMPIGTPLGEAQLAAIRGWIDGGAGPCEATP